MLENIKLCGYTTPTPVQAYCMPAIQENRDIIAIAQTGESQYALHASVGKILTVLPKGLERPQHS
jgi:hypothetical protein